MKKLRGGLEAIIVVVILVGVVVILLMQVVNNAGEGKNTLDTGTETLESIESGGMD